jgi:hypothetical protein
MLSGIILIVSSGTSGLLSRSSSMVGRCIVRYPGRRAINTNGNPLGTPKLGRRANPPGKLPIDNRTSNANRPSLSVNAAISINVTSARPAHGFVGQRIQNNSMNVKHASAGRANILSKQFSLGCRTEQQDCRKKSHATSEAVKARTKGARLHYNLSTGKWDTKVLRPALLPENVDAILTM